MCDGREILRSAQNDIGALKITMAWVRPHEVMDMGGVSRSAGKAGLKSMFHKLETYGGQCLQIPVFTRMTGFGAVLRFDKKNDVANRRALYGPTLERRLLKQALETRRYDEAAVSIFRRMTDVHAPLRPKEI